MDFPYMLSRCPTALGTMIGLESGVLPQAHMHAKEKMDMAANGLLQLRIPLHDTSQGCCNMLNNSFVCKDIQHMNTSIIRAAKRNAPYQHPSHGGFGGIVGATGATGAATFGAGGAMSASTNSTSNTNVAFGGITGGRPCSPYAKLQGIINFRFSPIFIGCTPCVQPLITRSKRNSIGLPRSMLLSNFLPSTK